jgi:FKBP-type peptidyl-prolyl cis-trans isomerase FkpA
MKKWLLLSALSALLFMGCDKNDSVTNCKELAPSTIAPNTEKTYLETYLSANNITNAIEKNGMFYVITSQGPGTSPNLCSNISIDYIGNFILSTTDGEVFDSSLPGRPINLRLSEVISGWKLILPLMKSGATATLYIPPSLAYGATGRGAVPGGAYLKFQITLRAVQ